MNEVMDDDSLLTAAEAARLLKVSTRTLERWEEAGWITSLRTPSNYRRFRRSDVLALLSSRAAS